MNVWSTLLTWPWQIPVAIYVIFVYVGVRTLGKFLANQGDHITRITLFMGLCALVAISFAAVTHDIRFDADTYVLMGVGALNAFANIAQWRANRVSMSKTSIMSFGDDVTAVILSWLILGDGAYLNAASVVGMLFCLITAVLFWWHDNKTKKESSTFYALVAVYCILWGIAIFAQRYFAFHRLPIGQFLFAWYVGTFLTMLSVFAGRWLFAIARGFTNTFAPFTRKDYALIVVFAAGNAVALAIEYWSKALAPLTVVQPIFLVSEAVIPTIMGWAIFREAKRFDRSQWIFASLGFIGVLVLASGFRGL